MKAIALATLFGMTVLAAGAANARAEPPFDCDPNAALLKQTQAARDAKDPLRAQSLVLSAQKANPRDFHTAYLLGLTLLDDSKYNPGTAVGQATLIKAADKLKDPRVAECARTHGWYSIYNAIGATYFNTNNLSAAERYFRLAERNSPTLDPAEQRKLFANLGLLYFIENKLALSEGYYAKAKAAASAPGTNAAVQKDIQIKLNAVHNLGSVPGQH